MRDDMAKVIVERPRHGGHGRRKGRAVADPDLLPTHKGLLREARESGDFKGLNENLSPLKRYLQAQLGRPWDKVWSEICANLRPTSTVQQHVRDHVCDFVAVRGVRWLDGDVFLLDYWGRTVPLRDSHFDLWVDPRTGILRQNRWRRRRRAREADRRRRQAEALRQRLVPAGEHVQYHLLDDGAWWEVTLAAVPMAERPRIVDGRSVGAVRVALPVRDTVIDARLSSLPAHQLYARHGIYAVAKRQLSKKEMKQLGLR